MPLDEIKCDLMVIGTGMAGMAAGLFAANRNIDIIQVGQASGINFASGLLDLLGVHPIASGCVWDDPWAAIEKLILDNPDHPYARLGTPMIRHAMEEFITFMEKAGQPYVMNPARNARVITPVGTVKTTYAVPKSMTHGVEAFTERIPCLLVGFHGLKGYSVRQIVETLGDRWPTLRAVKIPFPDLRGELYCEQLARSLEIMTVCDKLATAIKDHLGDAQAVGLPAVLGVNRTSQIMAKLERALGLPVFEIPTMIPSATGLRLREAFEQHLPRMGVRAFYQNRVLGVERTEEGSFRVQVGSETPSVMVRAGAVLLASGRFLGKGLRAERTGVHESIFDLPVFQPPRRDDWHQRDIFHKGGHPINRSGLEIDDDFRPVDEKQCLEYPNLYAAGSILAHQDWVRQKCGSGLAVATAYGAIDAYQRLSG